MSLFKIHSAIEETIESFKLDIPTVKTGISIASLISKMFDLLKFLIFFQSHLIESCCCKIHNSQDLKKLLVFILFIYSVIYNCS